jgi:hypothetical protein
MSTYLKRITMLFAGSDQLGKALETKLVAVAKSSK